MPIDEGVFHLARKYRRDAVEQVLAEVYPPVYRLACGLAGREDVGRGIVRFVMLQGVRQLPRWRDEDAAWRWFQHHTVLTSRRSQRHQPGAQEDLLATAAGPADAAQVAFVRALRALPMQQREAFVLHYGEGLAARETGIAMDCSTKAAEMHLAAARQTLEPIAGAGYAALLDRVKLAYSRLTPAEEIARPSVRACVARAMRPRRITRVVKLALFLGAAVAGGWAYLRYRDVLPWHPW